MGVQTELDLSGMTIVCKDLRVNSSNVGDTGTALSTTELAFVDGVTAGTVSASKAIVVDANKDFTGTRNISSTGTETILSATAVPAGGTTGSGFKMSSTANLGLFFGSGAPTLSAAQGSIYIRTDGSSTSTRLYINTNGSTTWTNVTTAA